MAKKRSARRRSPTPPEHPVWTEDQIDEALRDSFPASDPPPWTLGAHDTESDAILLRDPRIDSQRRTDP